jgi:hypothetical protein
MFPTKTAKKLYFTMCPLLELERGPQEEEVGFFWRVRLRMS